MFDEKLLRAVERDAVAAIMPTRYSDRIIAALCRHLNLQPEALNALAAGRAVVVPRSVLESLCEDAETYVKAQYGNPPHPALLRRYTRDIQDVQAARKLLAASPYAQQSQGGSDA